MASRDHPGGPWEQQDGVEVVNSKILFDVGMIWGVVYVSFGVSFVYRFLNRNFDVWDFQIEVLLWKVLQKMAFHENCFLWISESTFLVLWRPWEPLFWFFGP